MTKKIKKTNKLEYLTFADEDGNVVMRLKSDDLVTIVAKMIAEIFNKSEKVTHAESDKDYNPSEDFIIT